MTPTEEPESKNIESSTEPKIDKGPITLDDESADEINIKDQLQKALISNAQLRLGLNIELYDNKLKLKTAGTKEAILLEKNNEQWTLRMPENFQSLLRDDVQLKFSSQEEALEIGRCLLEEIIFVEENVFEKRPEKAFKNKPYTLAPYGQIVFHNDYGFNPSINWKTRNTKFKAEDYVNGESITRALNEAYFRNVHDKQIFISETDRLKNTDLDVEVNIDNKELKYENDEIKIEIKKVNDLWGIELKTKDEELKNLFSKQMQPASLKEQLKLFSEIILIAKAWKEAKNAINKYELKEEDILEYNGPFYIDKSFTSLNDKVIRISEGAYFIDDDMHFTSIIKRSNIIDLKQFVTAINRYYARITAKN